MHCYKRCPSMMSLSKVSFLLTPTESGKTTVSRSPRLEAPCCFHYACASGKSTGSEPKLPKPELESQGNSLQKGASPFLPPLVLLFLLLPLLQQLLRFIFFNVTWDSKQVSHKVFKMKIDNKTTYSAWH